MTSSVVDLRVARAATTGASVYRGTILAVALLLRLGVVSMALFTHPSQWLFRETPDLGFLADSLSRGRGLSSPFGGSTGPTAFLAPGYPAILGLVFRIFGSYSLASSAVMMALQTLFAVLTIALIMQMAERTFGAATANLAGAFWAVSLPLLWLPAILWETSLSILLLLGMVALAMRCADRPGKGLWMVLGAYCGLAMLVNPSLMLTLLALLGWTVWQGRRPGRSNEVWLCLLALAAVFAPWPIRNACVLHTFIPLRSNLGYELWQGNHPGGSGVFDATLEPQQNKQEYADYAAKGEVAYMDSKATLAKAWIGAHPGTFIGLSAGRVARFWTGAGSASNSGWVELHAVSTTLLGLAGLATLFQSHRDNDRATAMLFLLPMLIFPLPYYITHPDFRFRLLLDPLLTILGAYALTRLGCYWKSKRSA